MWIAEVVLELVGFHVRRQIKIVDACFPLAPQSRAYEAGERNS